MEDKLSADFLDGKQAVEHKLLRAVLDYFEFSKAAGFRMQIPDTDPPVYIVLGEKDLIRQLIADA